MEIGNENLQSHHLALLGVKSITFFAHFHQEKIRANYSRIKLKPEKFIDYLLSDEVGFAAFEVLEVPQVKTQGVDGLDYVQGWENRLHWGQGVLGL